MLSGNTTVEFSKNHVIKEIIENIQIVRGWSFSCLQ